MVSDPSQEEAHTINSENQARVNFHGGDYSYQTIAFNYLFIFISSSLWPDLSHAN